MPTFNRSKLHNLLASGHLKEIVHPTEDLRIIQYTEKAVADKRWTRETLSANTLIVDGEYNFVSRPFHKMFSVADYADNPKLGQLEWGKFPMLTMEKIDGTFGVLYFIGDEPFIATADGFNSDDAKVGNQILTEKYMQYPWDRDYTYLFEIVHPENQKVIDYQGARFLVLLAMIHTETGKEDIGQYMTAGFTNEFIIPQLVPANLTWREMLAFVSENGASEGIVTRFANGVRAKIQTSHYLKARQEAKS